MSKNTLYGSSTVHREHLKGLAEANLLLTRHSPKIPQGWYMYNIMGIISLTLLVVLVEQRSDRYDIQIGFMIYRNGVSAVRSRGKLCILAGGSLRDHVNIIS